MLTTTLEPISNVLAAFPSVLPTIVVLLKITCVLLFAFGATLLMPRASAVSRHLIWLVAVGALCFLPPVAVWSPLPLPVLPEQLATSTEPSVAVLNHASGTIYAPTQSSAQTPTAGQATGSTPAPESHLGLSTILIIGWAIVAAGLLARLMYGAWSVRRIVREARLLEHPDWQTPLYEISDRLGLAGAPTLVQSDEVKMPFAAGLFRSWIVLPAESESWTPERRTAVLIHELGHVRRRDLIGHTLSRIVCAVYWFHPLVWTAARRLRAESERACDDLALVFGARPSEYAEHLLDIVTCVRDHNTPAIALAMAHRKEFEGRMLAVLNPELRRRAPTRLETFSLVGSLGVMALLVGAAAPVARAAKPVSPAPVSSLTDSKQSVADTLHAVTTSRDVAKRVARPEGAAPSARPQPTPTPAVPHIPANVPSAISDAATGAVDDDRAALLAKALKTDKDPEVRRVAAWGLQKYANTDVAEEALVSAVGTDSDDDVREMAAWSLARAHESTAATAALIGALKNGKKAELRRTAAWALGASRQAGATEALTAALSDSDPEVRQIATWGIGSIRPETAPAAVIKNLSDPDADVRELAAWALFTIHDPKSIPAIEAAFDKETNSDVQEGLIRALGNMRGDAAVDALQKLVTSTDPKIRTVAITALAGGNAGGPWPWPWPWPRPYP